MTNAANQTWFRLLSAVLSFFVVLLHSKPVPMSHESLNQFRWSTTQTKNKENNHRLSHPFSRSSHYLYIRLRPLLCPLDESSACRNLTKLASGAQQGTQRPAMMYQPDLLRCTKIALVLHIPAAFDNPPT